MNFRNLDISCKLLSLLFQAHLLCWVLSGGATAQYDYDGAAEPASAGGAGESSRMAAGVARSLVPVQLVEGRTPWDPVNQVAFEKCMQLQRMAVKKRNFGLEIPDIIMNRVQGGTEGSTSLRDLKMRMMASGKRK